MHARQREARALKLRQLWKISSLVRFKIHRWNIQEVEKINTWRKVKRSSDKFALEDFNIVFFLAEISKGQPSEWRFLRISSRNLRYTDFVCFRRQENYVFKWKCIFKLVSFQWFFSQFKVKFKQMLIFRKRVQIRDSFLVSPPLPPALGLFFTF